MNVHLDVFIRTMEIHLVYSGGAKRRAQYNQNEEKSDSVIMNITEMQNQTSPQIFKCDHSYRFELLVELAKFKKDLTKCEQNKKNRVERCSEV